MVLWLKEFPSLDHLPTYLCVLMYTHVPFVQYTIRKSCGTCELVELLLSITTLHSILLFVNYSFVLKHDICIPKCVCTVTVYGEFIQVITMLVNSIIC